VAIKYIWNSWQTICHDGEGQVATWGASEFAGGHLECTTYHETTSREKQSIVSEYYWSTLK